jgi:osmotically-inducible protein OsmY
MTARNDSELSADERIWEEVRDRLMGHPDIDATEVEIEVEEAEVTLVGRVDTREGKWLAEEVSRAVPGVQDVHNRLKVARW